MGNDTTASRSDQIHSCFQSQHKISQVINRIIEFNSIDFVEMGYHSTKFHRLHYFEIHITYCKFSFSSFSCFLLKIDLYSWQNTSSCNFQSNFWFSLNHAHWTTSVNGFQHLTNVAGCMIVLPVMFIKLLSAINNVATLQICCS